MNTLSTYQKVAILKSDFGLVMSTFDSMEDLARQGIQSTVAMMIDDEEFFATLIRFEDHIEELRSRRNHEIAQEASVKELVEEGLSEREARKRVYGRGGYHGEDDE